MKPLSKELRNKFERTIENAREIAEEAARIALEQLGVGEASPYSYLSEDERALRRRLRAHGRNLGDVRDPKSETQEIDRLVEEIAYEHWHRMLFARFLAENDLLMYYEDDDIENAVPVTLSECDELAQEQGMKNGWEVAAKLATKMLPQVFRADSPVFKVELSPEKQRQLENLVSNIEGDVFKASDSLGWAYQFWQNKKKELINKSESKIGAKELPAVTQIFTEHYMVDFLLDNSIGAWYANKNLKKNKMTNIKIETNVKKELGLSNFSLDSLRLNKNDNQEWEPLIKDFIGWPENLSDFKLLDPCAGSGHFLVAAFNKLVPMRMALENLTAKEACDAVIKENIHGLEIDKRCVEIAAFAIALNAWKYPNAGGFRILPELQIAWCGQSLNMKRDEWIALGGNNNEVKMHLDALYNIFKNSSSLGSLIDPYDLFEKDSLFFNNYDEVCKNLEKVFNGNKDIKEMGVIAQGIEKTFNILNDKYHLVVTNVPYLGKGKMSEPLRRYVEKYYAGADDDLATSMIARCQKFCAYGGISLYVTSKNWMFIKTFEEFRLELLNKYRWNFVIDLGYKAFSTQMYDFPVCMISIENLKPQENDKIYSLSTGNIPLEEKIEYLIYNSAKVSMQNHQKSNPQNRIIFDLDFSNELMKEYIKSTEGLSTGDSDRFIANFWENTNESNEWSYYQTSPSNDYNLDGCSKIIYWQNGNGILSEFKGARIQGNAAWGKKGIIVRRVGQIRSNIYLGYLFDKSSVVLSMKDEAYFDDIWNYVKSKKFKDSVRKMDTKLGVATSVFENVPIDIDECTKENKYKYSIYSDDPTQWIFHGHPRKSIEPLQVAVARLLGYRWPAELDDEMELSDEARDLVVQSQSLLPYADKDGIVCIPSVRGEAPASERLLNLLAAAYKDEDINMKLPELLSNADHAGKSLESWLRDKFFTQHYKLFGHRPFIWQIWDGLKDGFSVLVNYHKLDRKNLETLIYTYLGDWISKQKSAMVDGIEGAEEKLNAALSLKKKLELILEGEAPYDIFVRWKPLNKQPLGWEPDLNDGVRVNIRPFMLVGDVGKKGAGVLRDKPNINWNKDRGKDTENSPWYHLFGGDRINDHHLTLEEKKKARKDEVKFS